MRSGTERAKPRFTRLANAASVGSVEIRVVDHPSMCGIQLRVPEAEVEVRLRAHSHTLINTML
jgi:hypothetical protein